MRNKHSQTDCMAVIGQFAHFNNVNLIFIKDDNTE